MLDLKGKWVLITGASRGLGRLAAKLMAEQGCNLILQSRSVDHTLSLEEEVKALGVKCHSFEADLNDIPSVMKMLSDIDALGVDVDVVLNNAGLQIAYRTEYLTTPSGGFHGQFQCQHDRSCDDLLSLSSRNARKGFRPHRKHYERHR